MQRRGSIIPIFIIFFLASLLLFFLSQKGLLRGVTGVFEQVTLPLQRGGFGLFHTGKDGDSQDLVALKEENRRLLMQLAKQKETEKENRALRDQFETTTPSSRTLLPAAIVGATSNGFILDKGALDNLKTGNVVVYQNNLIGKITQVSGHLSVFTFISDKSSAFTGETVNSSVLGVVKGLGGASMLFDNVVLSDTLKQGELIVTKGDLDTNGQGFPPGLVVGKIVSVNKKASNLFQQAEVRSLVNFAKMQMVFVITGE